jgi:MYXO-CTERM domain-containing protein
MSQTMDWVSGPDQVGQDVMNVRITAVPGPGGAALALAAGVGLLRRRRRDVLE